jgi:hypothetical protein
VAELHGLDAGAEHLGVALDELVHLGGPLTRVLRLRPALALLDDVHGAHPPLPQPLRQEATVSIRHEPTSTLSPRPEVVPECPLCGPMPMQY